MLRAAWNKAVDTYQSLRQEMDQSALDYQQSRKHDALNGFEYVAHGGHPTAFMGVEKIAITPARAEKIIKDADASTQNLRQRMQDRRLKYGLNF